MSTQCGGIVLDSSTLKTIEGVICEANAIIVSADTLVTACGGQQWDGGSFKATKVGMDEVVSYCANNGSIVGTPIVMKANCGLGVDKRFFELTSTGALKLNGGYLLKLDVTPSDAIVTVLDTESEEVDPIAGTTNQYICSGNVSVTVQKDGYQGKSQTVTMNAKKEVIVTIYPAVDLTVNVTTPATGATIVVKDADNVTVSPKSGTTNVFDVEDTQTYSVTVSADGYTTSTQSVTMDGDKTVTVALDAE